MRERWGWGDEKRLGILWKRARGIGQRIERLVVEVLSDARRVTTGGLVGLVARGTQIVSWVFLRVGEGAGDSDGATSLGECGGFRRTLKVSPVGSGC